MKFPKPIRYRNRTFLDNIKQQKCIVCGKPGTPWNPMTPSHIKTRGSGGGDEPWNVVPMHLSEHRRWEDDRYSFSMEHPAFYQKLQAMGWKFIEVVGQVRLVRRGELEHGVMDTYNDCVRPFKEFPYQENNITHICRRPKRKKRS